MLNHACPFTCLNFLNWSILIIDSTGVLTSFAQKCQKCQKRHFCLPFVADTIYFHLPGKGSNKDTVYGVSCYRQIDTKVRSKHSEQVSGVPKVLEPFTKFYLSLRMDVM